MSTPLRERPDAPLGTLIFRAGLLPAETIESALEEGVKTGKRLGEILTERGLISEIDLARLLAGQKGLDFVTLRKQIVDPSAATLFTEEQARLFRALPYSFDGELPVVAIADPTDDVLMRNIREALGRDDARFVVSAPGELAEIAADVYSRPLPPPKTASPEAASPPAPAKEEPVSHIEHRNGYAPADADLIAPPSAHDHEAAAPQEPAPFAAEVEATPEPELRPAFTDLHAWPEPRGVPVPDDPFSVEPLDVEPLAEPEPVKVEAPEPEPVATTEPEPFVAVEPWPEPLLLAEPTPVPDPVVPEAYEPPTAGEPTAAPEPPLLPERVSWPPQRASAPPPVEPLVAYEPLRVTEPALAPEPTALEPEALQEPEIAQEPAFVFLPPAAFEPPTSAEPVPLPQPPAPLPAPYPPAAEEPEPAPQAFEPPAETSTMWRMTIRLTNGERVEAGDFPDQAAAKLEARTIMSQVADADSDEWPFVSGRFLKPDTIVSVDIAELSDDDA